MKKILPLLVFTIFNITGCSTRNLVDDIYQHTYDNKSKESITAFIILSNMYLSEKNIENIEENYRYEKNEKKRYYYEYLLARRTQEEKYITAFIKSSRDNIPTLIGNDSNWISIESPIYKQLAYYSRTNDDALIILFKLMKISSGANLSIVTEDLFEIQKRSPKRFARIAQRVGVSKSEITNIMENE